MKSPIHDLHPRTLGRRLPIFLAALATAELLFRFGSFTLELLGLVVAWAVFDGLVSAAIHLATRSRAPSGQPSST